jgi:hypothetical protein
MLRVLGVCPEEQSDQGVDLVTGLNVVPGLRVKGAVTLHPYFASMAYLRTIFFLVTVNWLTGG